MNGWVGWPVLAAVVFWLARQFPIERRRLRETTATLETRLDREQFARIHRSTIANLRKVKELEPWFHGDYVVRRTDGEKLTLSRSYRGKLLERLGDGGWAVSGCEASGISLPAALP